MIGSELIRLRTAQRPWTESTELRIQRCENQMKLISEKGHSIKHAMRILHRDFSF